MDLYITRETPTRGVCRTKMTNEGSILFQTGNGLIMYEVNTGFTNKIHHDREMFHLYRLKNGKSNEGNPNFFKNMYHEGPALMGLGEDDVDTILNFDVSDSGVSENFESLYLTVSENYNGDLYKFKDGGLERICKVNREIYKFELESSGFPITENNATSNANIDTNLGLADGNGDGDADCDNRYSRFLDMKKLRINYMNWIRGIDFKYLMKSKNMLPLAVSSSFLCFTESREIWIYKYDNLTNKIQRLLSFTINQEISTEEDGDEVVGEGGKEDQDEFILYCVQSEWKKLDMVAGGGDEQMYTNFIMLSNKNRIIVKKCYFSIENNLFIVDEEEQSIEFDDYVLNYKVVENDVLCVQLNGSIEIVKLGDLGEAGVGAGAGAAQKRGKTNVKKIPSDVTISMENFISFKGEQNGEVHLIACNSMGEMQYVHLDTQTLLDDGTVKIIKSEFFSYWNEIKIDLPIFSKINELHEKCKKNERVYIDSLSVDEKERFVFMTTMNDNSLFDFEFVGSAGEREQIRFSILKTIESKEIDFTNVDDFNAITASCRYWIGTANLASTLGISARNSTEKDTQEEDRRNGNNNNNNDNDNAFNQLFNALFMDPEIQRARVQAVISKDALLLNKMRARVQNIIKESVLKMVSTGGADAKNEMDVLMVTLMQGSKGVCNVPVAGTDMLESFDGLATSSEKGGKHGDGLALSLSGHLWRTCTITGVPLVGGPGSSLECGVCGAKRAAGSAHSQSHVTLDETLVDAVLRAAGRVCCVCGGRWTA